MIHSPLFKLFLKFAVVGGSGVIVNLACLALFRKLGFKDSLASAMAIELSIVSNFILNECWTFKERISTQRSWFNRVCRFQAVSFVGAFAQWSIFLLCNLLWIYFDLSHGPNIDLWSNYAPLLIQGGWQVIIITPPRVGDWVYLSQMIGIAVATLWNFSINYYWTWGKSK